MKDLAVGISEVVTTWLKEEADNADDGRNSLLSEFDKRKADFELPFDDPSNINAQKIKSHYSRVRLWAAQYIELAQAANDQATARLIFCSLMFISGAYRRQCYLTATSADEYYQMRYGDGPTSVNVTEITERELADRSTLHINPDRRLDNLVARIINVSDITFANSKLESVNPEASGSTLGLTAVESTILSQELWTGLTVAQIMVAASFRDGSYAAVPFFEPKSITDQTGLQYPLA